MWFVEEVAAVGIQDDLSDEKLNIYIVLDSKKFRQESKKTN